MKNVLTALLVCISCLLHAQVVPAKKIMDHSVYHFWKKIDRPLLSNDGKWAAYATVSNTEGDATLHLWKAADGITVTFARGAEAVFTEDNQYLVFKIKQPLDSLKAKRRKKVKDEDLPKDSLGIYSLADGNFQKIANVKSFAVPAKWSGYIAYQLEIEKTAEPTGKETTKDSTTTKPKTKPKAENKDNGSKIILHDLMGGQKDTFYYGTEYTFAKRGKRFLVTDTGSDSMTHAAVRLVDCDKKTKQVLIQKKGKYKQLTLDEYGLQAAFVADFDTTKERVRPNQMMYWSGKPNDTLRLIARSNTDYGTLKNYLVSDNTKPIFSEDGTKLYFGLSPQPILNDTTLLPEEIVNVEVWRYDEKRLHTQQKVRLEQERKRSFTVAYYPMTRQLTPLSNPDVPDVEMEERRNLDVAITSTEEPYVMASTWEGFSPRDYYLTDIKTGNSTLIAAKIRGRANLSPSGKYVYWYNSLDSTWSVYSILNKNTLKITDNKTVKYYEEENDVPDYPQSYGITGWIRDDRYILINDRYDIWRIDPLGKEKPTRLTEGRTKATTYRYIKLDDDERFIEPTATLLLHTVNDKSKAQGYAQLNLSNNALTPLVEDNFAFTPRPIKAKNAQAFLFTKQHYSTFPDLLYSTDIKNTTRVSDVNPQQSEYNWGSIELVEWTALDGQKLRGMLVKPDGFDPTKKYPMIVNFYEKSSDELHTYRAPEPLRSQINYTFYANRGYLVFNPDIPYRIGYPGESCLNAVVAGVTHLINQGFVDEKRIGVQGHSWGGYQVAYLITKTNIFKCAESGAPVVNMVSAYGGIRWESGLMRMFQYEHTQSRIGGSLWEYPLRFLENSPIFSADKIQTPVLILHNDKDGAVPWYQGIEFYGALRRLNKPAWLLNYNDEPHWPVKLQNRIDFQIRMQQFFDYYLKDAPMPRWMQRGVPAIEKGILQGYETATERK